MSNVPKHVAIVMDGNGRWAKSQKQPRVAGHRAGAKAVRRAIQFCLENHIPTLTLFALSTDNRSGRPAKEVDWLLKLFHDSLKKHTQELHENGVRIRVIGDRSVLSASLLQKIEASEAMTQKNTTLQLTVAVNYSGRWDMLQATQRFAVDCMKGLCTPENLDEQSFQQYVCFSDLPEPDLMIRTSGELRLSNFMLWQMAYTEFYFTPVFWPDFDGAAFQAALEAFSTRSRRYGLTEEQAEEAGYV